jgi:hypothetical protein
MPSVRPRLRSARSTQFRCGWFTVQLGTRHRRTLGSQSHTPTNNPNPFRRTCNLVELRGSSMESTGIPSDWPTFWAESYGAHASGPPLPDQHLEERGHPAGARQDRSGVAGLTRRVPSSAKTPSDTRRPPNLLHGPDRAFLDKITISLNDIIMRTLIDLPDEQIKALDRYRAKKKISRAEAVRRAVAAFLPRNRTPETDWANHPAFGCTKKGRKSDSTDFVRRIRGEWSRKR